VISRRKLLIQGPVIAGAVGALPAQVEPPFKLEFGSVDLEAELAIKMAIVTSGYTTCQVRIFANDGSLAVQSKDWGTEPNAPLSLEAPPPKKKGPYRTMAEMRPTRNAKPSMALAISQNPAIDLKTLEKIAHQVRFLKDPAPRPEGGRFIVDAPVRSMLQIQIWRGERCSGKPLYENRVDNVGPGPTPIPWNLRTVSGPAGAGRYLAYLICTPKDERRRATGMYSYFGVA
jgi:hypothetical protein